MDVTGQKLRGAFIMFKNYPYIEDYTGSIGVPGTVFGRGFWFSEKIFQFLENRLRFFDTV